MPDPDRIELSALLLHVHIGLQAWLQSNNVATSSTPTPHPVTPASSLKHTLDLLQDANPPQLSKHGENNPFLNIGLYEELGTVCMYLHSGGTLDSNDKFRVVDSLARLAIAFDLPHWQEFYQQRELYWKAIEFPSFPENRPASSLSPLKSSIPSPRHLQRTPLELRDALFYDLEWLLSPYRSMSEHSISAIQVLMLAQNASERMVLTDYFINNQNAQFGPALIRHLREAELEIFKSTPIEIEIVLSPPEQLDPETAQALTEKRHMINLVSKSNTPAPPSASVAQLRLIKGGTRSSNRTFQLKSTDGTCHIGRNPVVQYGNQGTRYNQITFDDEAQPEYAEISRAHASIQFDPATRSFKIRDDGSRFGTMIIRGVNRTAIPVRRHFRRLENGDRIQLGSGVVLEFMLMD